jgi:gamma-glutamyltranspeptidase/glutathione hydrolase
MLRGYTPQAALDSPRFCISAGSPDSQTKDTGKAGDINSEVYLEEGIPLETVEKLRGKYHRSLPFDPKIYRCRNGT